MPTHQTFSGATHASRIDPEHLSGSIPVAKRPDSAEKRVPYLLPGSSMSMRNGSTLSLESLKEEDYEALGGVEYQALRALVWLVPGVISHMFCGHGSLQANKGNTVSSCHSHARVCHHYAVHGDVPMGTNITTTKST